MTTVFAIALVILTAAAGLAVLRLLRPSSLVDRIIALDFLLSIVVSGTAVAAAYTGTELFMTVLVVAALLGFVGTTMVARYVDERGL